jgi:DNA/RNA-binding domain of Phe-tRNA-synthetase-like protein
MSGEVSGLGVVGCYFLIEGLKNAPHASEFGRLRDEELEKVLVGLTDEAIKSDEILRGFRLLHERVKCSNRKHTASPENLLGMLNRNRRLPTINLLVDIYNLVSCKTRLALGAHDTNRISGNVELRLTNGDEVFFPLGANERKPVGKGEYAYIDSSNEVICRLETRQVEKTKVTLDTQNCFYIVQGNPATPADYVRKTSTELIELTQRFCGGTPHILYECR